MRYPWHEEIGSRIRTLQKANTLPSAICLSGSPGWGTTQLLNDITCLLLEIPMHTQVSQLAHPDVRWIVPDGSVIKIEQVRGVNDFAVLTANIAPRKVAAIVDADKLNINAANALLKTLEEPPRNTHLLLATSRWGRLIPTIRSRCQRFEMPCDPTVALQWLHQEQSKQDNPQDVSEELFAEMGYAPLAALSALTSATADVDTWLLELKSMSFSTAVEQVLELDGVDWLGRWYRRILGHLKGNRLAGLQASDQQVLVFVDELLDSRRQLIVSNSTNAKLLFERLLSEWTKLSRGGPTLSRKSAV